MNTLTRLFPVPRALAMPTVGIDISDSSVKCAELTRTGEVFVLGRTAEELLEPGIVATGGKIEKPEKLAAVLAKLKEKNNLLHVVASLPEEQAYLLRLAVPYMKKSELRESIELSLEEHVPLSPADLIFDFEIAREPAHAKDVYEVSVAVLPKVVVGAYMEAFEKADLHPVAFEIEPYAIARAVLPAHDTSTAMIVDLGKTRTGFAIADQKGVWFSSTIALGGDSITKALARGLSISYDEAERLKKERGLSRAPEDKQMFAVIVPILAALKDEITKHYIYWKTHKDDSGMNRGSIEKVVLSGGQASFVGLSEYLSLGLGVPVVQGNPWVNILSFDRQIPQLPYRDALRYTTALGLALRAASPDIV